MPYRNIIEMAKGEDHAASFPRQVERGLDRHTRLTVDIKLLNDHTFLNTTKPFSINTIEIYSRIHIFRIPFN